MSLGHLSSTEDTDPSLSPARRCQGVERSAGQRDRAGPAEAGNKGFEEDVGEGERMWREHLPILILPISLGLGQNKKSLEKKKDQVAKDDKREEERDTGSSGHPVHPTVSVTLCATT